jgi:L-seryl-tRNA(Ser) seleniumtransferase
MDGRASVKLTRASGRVGGGALPLAELEGPVVSVRPKATSLDALQRSLRSHDPPVVARVSDGALLLDPRTMTDDEAALAADAIVSALSSSPAR